MRFNIENIPEEVRQVGPRPGDVFPTKGGRGKAKMWLVLEVSDGKMHMVGLDRDGCIVSTATYGDYAFEDRPVIGHAPDVAKMVFEIDFNERGLRD